MSGQQPYTPPYVPQAASRPGGSDGFARSWRAGLRVWWREIDRVLLVLVLMLMGLGMMAVAAASPASADRLSTAEERLPELYFYWAHLRWQAVGLVAMIGASMLSAERARRVGVMIAGGMLFFLLLVPLVGAEVNGARRWIDLGIRFQPSEFLKPGFAIALAWIMCWRLRDPHLPVLAVVSGAMGLVTLLLMLQPNLGDAILFAGVWFVLVLLAGVPLKHLGGMIGAGVAVLGLILITYENGWNRLMSFFSGGTAFDQVDLAERTLLAGGWTGSGFLLGVRKMNLPEAHTDYIFSVIGEEFGLIFCALIVLLYLAIIARVLVRLANEDNLFTLLAGAGLVTQIGGQAFINILVNLQLFPSKGMTLPLVSYGGSSTIAVCLTVGLLLAVTRRNPYLTRETPGLREMIADRFAAIEGARK